MKTLIKYLFFIFMTVEQLFVTAQDYSFYNNSLSQKSNRFQGKLMGEVFYLNSISNTYFFLQPEWVEGTITLKDNDIFEGVKFRYMAYGDELVVYNENNYSLFVIDKSTVKQFTFSGYNNRGEQKERKFINLDTLELAFNRSFFEELYSGRLKFLCFRQIEQEKVTPYTGKDGKLYDSEYRLKNKYFLLSEETGIVRIQLKNRAIISIFPEKKKEIRKQLRKNKIRIADEYSAIGAFSMLDESGLLN